MLHHAGESLKHAHGLYCSAKHKEGNTGGNRLEKQFVQSWLKSDAEETVHGTVGFPRGTLARVNGTRAQGTEAA